METTTALLFTFPQYIFIGIAFHTATQFRKSIYTNIPFMLLLTLQFSIAGWIILGPQGFQKSALEIETMPFYFRYTILFCALGNGFLTILFEQIIIRVFGHKEMQEVIVFDKGKEKKPSNGMSHRNSHTNSDSDSDHLKNE
jgi:hypothetical protein